MNWFIADLHFGHRLEALKRPFNDSRMDELMVKNWNERIQPKDKVYVLGDFSLHMSFDVMEHIFNLLNGDKHLILGNHDHSNKVHKLRWGSVHDVFMLNLPETPGFWLSHYPHRSWPRSCHGSYHLFGHVHGKMPPSYNSLDVGVDCNNYCPLSLEEVMEKIPKELPPGKYLG